MVREGYIRKIIYQNEENGYAVFSVEGTEGEETFVGMAAGIAEGMYIQAEGEYVHHPQYDIQFKIRSFELSVPDDTEGIIRFLGSGAIKGIGETLARRIVKKFGKDTFRIIDEEPERLAEVKGISERMAEQIAVYYEENQSFRNVILFLSRYGVSVKSAMKIYRTFGDEIYRVIRENPYRVADEVEGIGFRTADEIAMRAGIPRDSRYRVQASVLYLLNQATLAGNMFLPEDMLSQQAYRLLEIETEEDDFQEELHDILFGMEMEHKVVLKKEPAGNTVRNEAEESFVPSEEEASQPAVRVYTSWNYHLEVASARMLYDLKMRFETDEKEFGKAIQEIEEAESITLEEEQKEAVKAAICSGVAVITGGPGTGKTTIIRAIIRYFEQSGKEALLAAPTGRAAKRITESTGYQAKTIHRLLEFSGGQRNQEGEESGDSDQELQMKFMRNEGNPLECDAVIVDEASMIDTSLLYSLLKALTEGTRLILVGDTDQLPSVGAGNVLSDIIQSGCFEVRVLNRIFRQAGESDIIQNAHRIRRGETLSITNHSRDFFFIPHRSAGEIRDEVSELVERDLPKYLKVSPYEIQVLTPMRKSDLGSLALNQELQKKLNPPAAGKKEKISGNTVFREGDKVMQIRNDYKMEWRTEEKGFVTEEGIGVFNGDMGIITEIDDFNEQLTVTFDDGRKAVYSDHDLDELEHAFAITIHKSQGSEYPAVVIPLLSGPPKLLNRNLLYTAVSRARKLVVIVGNIGLVNQMIQNVTEQKRFTSLDERLREINAIEQEIHG